MTRPARQSIETVLAGLPGWTKADDPREAVTRSFKFADFNAAFGFMTRVAIMADRLDHHPEWSNVYNRVDVILTTHDAGGVTELDLKLGQFMNSLI